MANNTELLDMLIRIREDIAGLDRTRAGIRGVRQDANELAGAIKQGLGVGSGMEIARRGIDLLTSSLRASVGQAFHMAEEIKDQSEALGVTAEAYQVVRYELAQAGVDMGRFGLAVNEQTQSLAAARTGVGAAAEAYKELGLQASQLERLTPEQRVLAVARAVLNATDQTKAFQAAGAILGSRGLPQLLSALKNLSTEGYDKVAASAKEAGRIMGDYTIEQLDAAKKKIDNFTQTTLPVATGGFLGMFDNIAKGLGAFAGNVTNWAAGRPTGYLTGDFGQPSTSPKPPPAPAAVPPATEEARIIALIAAEERKAEAINNGLFTEAERRRALLPIIKEQAELTELLVNLKFGGKAWLDPAKAELTEEQLAEFKERNELEAKLIGLRQQRMQAVDTPLQVLNRDLLDTAGLIEKSLAGGINSGVASLSQNIWGALKGTNSLGESWRNLGDIAGSVLTEILVKLLIIRPLLAMFGVTDGAPVGGSTSGVPEVRGAGGGTFLTHGPAHFTVGDNPGGVELVSVLPISGIGQSTLNGAALRMAGGGTALVAGGRAAGGDTIHVHNTFNGGVSRAEVLGMVPAIVEASKAGVVDAQRRRRGGHRS